MCEDRFFVWKSLDQNQFPFHSIRFDLLVLLVWIAFKPNHSQVKMIWLESWMDRLDYRNNNNNNNNDNIDYLDKVEWTTKSLLHNTISLWYHKYTTYTDIVDNKMDFSILSVSKQSWYYKYYKYLYLRTISTTKMWTKWCETQVSTSLGNLGSNVYMVALYHNF